MRVRSSAHRLVVVVLLGAASAHLATLGSCADAAPGRAAAGRDAGPDEAADSPRANDAPDSPRADADVDAFDPAALAFPFCPEDPERTAALYDRLTPRQRIGQHVMTGLNRAGTRVDARTERLLRTYALGGGFVSQIEEVAVGSPETTARFLHDAQRVAAEAAGVPLFIASDQEGGVYTSVNHLTGGTDSIGPAAIGATGDEWVAYHQFDLMGREVKALGINLNLGPLLDTLYERDNGNLNTRVFGPDVGANARFGVAAVAGLQQNLVLAVVKHFPGDGLTSGNTHHEFVTNDAPLEVLEERLLGPFRAAIAAGCDGVMTMPARFSALDDRRAAVVSRPVTTGFLRGTIGFDGLVVTDDLNMYGARLGLAESESEGVAALAAGADVLLYVAIDDTALEELFADIEAALLTGAIPAAQFAQSTQRILRLKQKYCLFDAPTYPDAGDVAALPSRIRRPADAARSALHAERAVTVLEDDGVLPLRGKRVLCVGPAVVLPDPASGWSWLLERSFCAAVRQRDPAAQTLDFVVGASEATARAWVESRRATGDVIVVATFQSYFGAPQRELLAWLRDEGGLPVVHVSQGVPFDHLQTRGRVAAALALMGSLPVLLDAGARVLYGEAEAGGRMPYDLSR
jgi:beta-N-acetylhexosaminidase